MLYNLACMAKVTCCSLSQLKNVMQGNDVNLFIVRNPKNDIKDLTWFPYLAPSQALYSFAMENKDNAGWLQTTVFRLQILYH